jgi:hypothetical protein
MHGIHAECMHMDTTYYIFDSATYQTNVASDVLPDRKRCKSINEHHVRLG